MEINYINLILESSIEKAERLLLEHLAKSLDKIEERLSKLEQIHSRMSTANNDIPMNCAQVEDQGAMLPAIYIIKVRIWMSDIQMFMTLMTYDCQFSLDLALRSFKSNAWQVVGPWSNLEANLEILKTILIEDGTIMSKVLEYQVDFNVYI